MPPITKELVKANPGVTSFIAGGTYNIPVQKDDTYIQNAPMGTLGGSMGGQPAFGRGDRNLDPLGQAQQSSGKLFNALRGTSGITDPNFWGNLSGQFQPIPGASNNQARRNAMNPAQPLIGTQPPTPILTPPQNISQKDDIYTQPPSRPTTGTRARGNEPVKNASWFTQTDTKNQNAIDIMETRGAEAGLAAFQEVLKKLPEGYVPGYSDTTGEKYAFRPNNDGTYTRFDISTKLGDLRPMLSGKGEVYDPVYSETEFDDNGYPLIDHMVSRDMMNVWKAWDMYGIVPQTISADWVQTLRDLNSDSMSSGFMNAKYMQDRGFELDPYTMTWYQSGNSPKLGRTNTSTSTYSGSNATGGAYKFTIEDWESGYRPYSVNVQHAINLGITDDWMRENGYTLAGGIWVKGAGSGGSGNNEGGGNNGGYSGYYQQPSPINRRVSTG
jgi:hypothetical protein